MSKLKGLAIFAAGLICGGVATYVATKNKYEKILDEEIASVKETYKNRTPMIIKEETKDEEVKEEVKENDDEDHYVPNEKDKKDYNKILSDNGYVNYTKYMSGVEKEREHMVDDRNEIPYVIEPDEFGEDGYDTQTLTYYSDNVLVDDLDDIVEDPEIVVGIENLKVFDEFGATSVLVRNEIFKMDYEIIKDDWKYSDFKQDVPPKEKLVEYYRNKEREKKPHEL